MEIREAARKHGVEDDDIQHAVRHATRAVELDDSRTLLIGADRAGRLLEVVVVDLEGDRPRVIHAMGLRPKFYGFL